MQRDERIQALLARGWRQGADYYGNVVMLRDRPERFWRPNWFADPCVIHIDVYGKVHRGHYGHTKEKKNST